MYFKHLEPETEDTTLPVLGPVSPIHIFLECLDPCSSGLHNHEGGVVCPHELISSTMQRSGLPTEDMCAIVPSIRLQKIIFNSLGVMKTSTLLRHQSQTHAAVHQLNVNTDESPRCHRTPAPRPETPTPLPGAVERARLNSCQSRCETLRYFNSQDLIFNNVDAYFITENVSFTFPYSYSPA